jgi:membrane-associated phospholipid phosphatase
MDSLIKLIAKDFIIIPPLVAVYFWYYVQSRADRRRSLIFLITLAALSLILATIAQHLYMNPRPPYKDGSIPLFQPSDRNGFPSDHTLFASVIGFWLLHYNRRFGIGMLALALIIGWARVAAHVHHAVDIVGAVAITALAYGLTIAAQRYFKPARKS